MALLRLVTFLCTCSWHFSIASFTPDQQAMCAIAIGNSLDSLTEAGVRIWSAVETCNITETNNSATNKKNHIICAADIGQVLVPVAEAAEFAVTIVGDCFHAHLPMQECIRESLRLAGDIADLTSYAMSLEIQCSAKDGESSVGVGVEQTSCALDVNDALDSLLNLFSTATHMQSMCKKSAKECAESVSLGVSQLGEVARYVLAAIEDCSASATGTMCAATATGLVAATSGIVSSAIGVERACGKSSSSAKKVFKEVLAGQPITKPHLPVSKDTKDALAATLPDLAQFAVNHKMAHDSPAVVQAKIMGILRSNLTKVSRLFSVGSSKRKSRQVAKDSSQFEFKPTKNMIILGCIPVAVTLSFLLGRKSVF